MEFLLQQIGIGSINFTKNKKNNNNHLKIVSTPTLLPKRVDHTMTNEKLQ